MTRENMRSEQAKDVAQTTAQTASIEHYCERCRKSKRMLLWLEYVEHAGRRTEVYRCPDCGWLRPFVVT